MADVVGHSCYFANIPDVTACADFAVCSATGKSCITLRLVRGQWVDE